MSLNARIEEVMWLLGPVEDNVNLLTNGEICQHVVRIRQGMAVKAMRWDE